jgi:predicted HicB family RNase H-like nuclease
MFLHARAAMRAKAQVKSLNQSAAELPARAS